MITRTRIRVVLLFVLSLVAVAGAQERSISREEFDLVKANAEAVLSKTPYRVRSTHESFSDGTDSTPDKVSVWMTEYVRPDREHNFYGLNASDPTRRYERIRIGEQIFTTEDGVWKKWENSGLIPPPPRARPESARYYAIGTDKIGDLSAKVYAVVTTRKFWVGNEEKESVYREKYWVSLDSRLLKTVGESDGVSSKRSRTTEIYEYDSKIKIEQPIR